MDSHRKLIALALFVFALALRLCGAGWGLKNDLHNASYHPDEPIIFANSRAIVPGLGQFTPPQPIPRFYSYGTLYLTLLRVVSDVTTTYTGAPSTTTLGNPEKTDWGWVSRCHFAGRLISCVAGAGTAIFVCLVLFELAGSLAGVAGGALIAVAPAHVLHSRFQTVDILATFFLSVSLFYSMKLAGTTHAEPDLEPPSKSTSAMKFAMLSGLFAGLSAGTKYTGMIAILSLMVAAVIQDRKRFLGPVIFGTLTACFIFLFTTPGVVLQTSAFLTDFNYEMTHTATGHGLLFTGTSNGYSYTFTNLLFGIGPLPVVVGLIALVYAAFRRRPWAWIALAFFVPYFLLIGHAEVKFARYSFPLYLGVACGFGYAMEVCQRRGGWWRIGVGVGILGLGGVPFGGAATSAALTASMMGQDARDQAATYLRENPGPVGLTNSPWFWTPPYFKDAEDPLFIPLPEKLYLAQFQSRPPLSVAYDDANQVIPAWSSQLLTRNKPPLISFSSFEYFPILRLSGRKDLAEQQKEVDSDDGFVQKLQTDYTIDRQFGSPMIGSGHPEFLPEDFYYTDPVIYIWKRKG
jgi:hypothetical protein